MIGNSPLALGVRGLFVFFLHCRDSFLLPLTLFILFSHTVILFWRFVCIRNQSDNNIPFLLARVMTQIRTHLMWCTDLFVRCHHCVWRCYRHDHDDVFIHAPWHLQTEAQQKIFLSLYVYRWLEVIVSKCQMDCDCSASEFDLTSDSLVFCFAPFDVLDLERFSRMEWSFV